MSACLQTVPLRPHSPHARPAALWDALSARDVVRVQWYLGGSLTFVPWGLLALSDKVATARTTTARNTAEHWPVPCLTCLVLDDIGERTGAGKRANSATTTTGAPRHVWHLQLAVRHCAACQSVSCLTVCTHLDWQRKENSGGKTIRL